MNVPITISATVNAFNTNGQWLSNEELLKRAEGVLAGEYEPAVVLGSMHLTPSDMKGIEGWSLIGSAEVTVTFFPRDQMVAEELKSLNDQLDHARAEWLTKQQEIMGRISKLQALTNEVEA